uniref:Uncharacterized protein n=1 Tax=Timema bartmani TaxID=61472 RepID=A0A7R9EPL3_9NEOP|nr:unnamed protein product [Timema bartmani]
MSSYGLVGEELITSAALSLSGHSSILYHITPKIIQCQLIGLKLHVTGIRASISSVTSSIVYCGGDSLDHVTTDSLSTRWFMYTPCPKRSVPDWQLGEEGEEGSSRLLRLSAFGRDVRLTLHRSRGLFPTGVKVWTAEGNSSQPDTVLYKPLLERVLLMKVKGLCRPIVTWKKRMSVQTKDAHSGELFLHYVVLPS